MKLVVSFLQAAKMETFLPHSPKDALSGNNLNHSEKFAYCCAFVFFLKNRKTMQLGKKEHLHGIKVNWYVSNKPTIELKS